MLHKRLERCITQVMALLYLDIKINYFVYWLTVLCVLRSREDYCSHCCQSFLLYIARHVWTIAIGPHRLWALWDPQQDGESTPVASSLPFHPLLAMIFSNTTIFSTEHIPFAIFQYRSTIVNWYSLYNGSELLACGIFLNP